MGDNLIRVIGSKSKIDSDEKRERKESIHREKSERSERRKSEDRSHEKPENKTIKEEDNKDNKPSSTSAALAPPETETDHQPAILAKEEKAEKNLAADAAPKTENVPAADLGKEPPASTGGPQNNVDEKNKDAPPISKDNVKDGAEEKVPQQADVPASPVVLTNSPPPEKLPAENVAVPMSNKTITDPSPPLPLAASLAQDKLQHQRQQQEQFLSRNLQTVGPQNHHAPVGGLSRTAPVTSLMYGDDNSDVSSQMKNLLMNETMWQRVMISRMEENKEKKNDVAVGEPNRMAAPFPPANSLKKNLEVETEKSSFIASQVDRIRANEAIMKAYRPRDEPSLDSLL